MKTLHQIAYALVIIGALNWGLIALFNLNLVTTLFGSMPDLERLIYVLVGVSAVWEAFTHMSYCRYCGDSYYGDERVIAVKKSRGSRR